MHVVLFKSPSPPQRCGEGTIGEIDNMLQRPKPGIMFSASQGSMRVWLEQLRACHAQTAVNHAVNLRERQARTLLEGLESASHVMMVMLSFMIRTSQGFQLLARPERVSLN
jgi:hypothetical protein